MNTQENWEVTKHATPEYAPQYGVYVEGERNDFCIVKGEDAEAKAHLIAAVPKLLAACRHGAASIHHPACSHGKRGDGNTCECHVKKCQEAIDEAESGD